MSAIRCVKCGASLRGEDPAADLCANCVAIAIAEAECAWDARAIPSPPREAVQARELCVPQSSLEPRGNDQPERSILREYHASFLRVFLYYLLWVAFLIGCVVLMALWMKLS